jgi:DNA invertase Pin-like site-specific DNA recombinase
MIARRLNDEEKEKILEMRREGKRQKEIADIIGIALSTVKYRLRKAGFPTGLGSGFPSEQRRPIRVVSSRTKREVLRRLKRGESVLSVAKRFALSRRLVGNIQRRHRIKSRYRRRIPLALRKKIVAFPGSGRAAARKYGVTSSTASVIRRQLRQRL